LDGVCLASRRDDAAFSDAAANYCRSPIALQRGDHQSIWKRMGEENAASSRRDARKSSSEELDLAKSLSFGPRTTLQLRHDGLVQFRH